MSDAPAVSLGGRVLQARSLLGSPAAVVGAGLTTVTMLVAIAAPVLAPGDPFATVAEPFLTPSWGHPMGTDDLGRDLLRAVIHGARTSMTVATAVVAVSTVIGLVVGLVAGYRGGLVDDVLMRVTEMFQAVPRFFLAILAVALLGAGTENVILVLALTSWPWLARVVRAETMSLKEREFVAAARSMGVAGRTLVVRHVVPNLLPAAMVVVTLTAARVILLEASLGFLGLGDPNAVSWGYLADNAQRFLRTAWWMSFFPGLAIVGAVLGFSLLGDAIVAAREPLAVVTPRTRRRPARRTAAVAVAAGVAALAVVAAAVLRAGDGATTQPAAPATTVAPRTSAGATTQGLQAGDCFDAPAVGDDDAAFGLVPCGLPHTDEVFAVVELDAAAGDPYPARIDDEAQLLCSNEYIDFVGADPARSELAYAWYVPTEAAWSAGARRVACVVADRGGEPRVGSAFSVPPEPPA